MRAIEKARAWSNTLPTRKEQGPLAPPLFVPYGSSSYYGRGYRWEQVRHYQQWQYVAINAWMAEIAGGEPPKLGWVNPKQEKSKRYMTKALGGPKEHEEFEPFPSDNPLQRLFNNPNKPYVAYDLFAYHTLFLALTGVSYWWCIRDGLGIPRELWVLPSHWVQLITDMGDGKYYYLVQSPWGPQQVIPFDDVVVFQKHSPWTIYEGFGISLAIREWVDTYENNMRARLAQYINGAIPAFAISLADGQLDPDDATLERYYQKYYARFQGANNTGKPIITGPGVEVKALGISPVDMGYDRTEDQIRDMILAAYGVPGAIVGLTKEMTYGSVKATQDAFRDYSVNPMLTYMGQVITEKILRATPGYENALCFWENRAKGDPDFLLRQEDQDLRTGVKAVNEVRTARGLEAYPHGGDNPMINGVLLPWQKPEASLTEETQQMEMAFQRSMSTSCGTAGGYLVPPALPYRNGRNGVHK